MEEFERKFEMRGGIIAAMKVMTEALDKATARNCDAGILSSMKREGMYILANEFRTLLEKKYKELGG